MKQTVKKLWSVAALLLLVTAVYAEQTVTVVKQLNGTANDKAGTVTYEVNASNNQCVLTVTPAEGNYITVEYITAEKVVAGDAANARHGAPGMSEPITVTAVETPTEPDPSGTTQYQFEMPGQDYDVVITANFQQRVSIADGTLTLSIPQDGYAYNGDVREPTVTVTVANETLADDKYTVAYGNNDHNNIDAGEVTVTVTGVKTYTGTLTTTFTIAPRQLTDEMVTLMEPDMPLVYNGEAQTVEVSLYDVEMKSGLNETDYEVAYANNINVGTATVTITGKGNYQGVVTKTFDILRQLEISFNENQWATYIAAENLEVPAGLEAYVVSNVKGSTVTVSQVDYLPAGVGVLLFAVELSDWFVAAAYPEEPETVTSLLQGCANATPVASLTADNVYVLYNDEFVKTVSGTIPAGRCYLPVANTTFAGARLAIHFADEATAVKGIRVADGDKAQWYDLGGRRLSAQPVKAGVYIVNGRKVIVK